MTNHSNSNHNLDHPSCPQTIPKIVHRIWFGSDLPEEYKRNLESLVANNPDYCAKLWIDSAIISSQDEQNLVDFCQKNNIQLHDVRNYPHLSNFNLITQELDKSINKRHHRCIHFARASDLARIAILIHDGGIYTDTDTKSLKKLPELIARFGLLLKEVPGLSPDDQHFLDADDVHHLFYDFIAAVPGNEILQLAAKISELDYLTYSTSSNRLWESSKSSYVQELGTVRLTGSALRWACQYYVSHGTISPKNRADLFFVDKEYLSSSYDKSWLENQGESCTKKERDSLLAFMGEIEQKRAGAFPLNFAFIVNRLVLKVEEPLSILKKYAVNSSVLQTITELEAILEQLKNADLQSINSQQQTKFMDKQKELGKIFTKMNQINDSCFEGKEESTVIISCLRSVLNTITSLFTGTKENTNWLAEKLVKRPFFIVKPRTSKEYNEIQFQLSELNTSQEVAEKLVTC
jgi:hypothetical protein